MKIEYVLVGTAGWIKGETFRYQLGFLEMVITADILSVNYKKKKSSQNCNFSQERKENDLFVQQKIQKVQMFLRSCSWKLM